MMRELIVDSFAGGGGASEGIRAATGRDPDIAINHDRAALAMHRINHPGTRHIAEDVWHVDPVAMCDGQPIGMLWLSPDCKHFSKAKGGKPREKEIRGLAWIALKWVKALPKWQRPRVIFLENVEEFQDWGPLLDDGTPCPVQKGATFRNYVSSFKALGYKKIEWQERRAWRAGAPTIRKRLYVIMRRDDEPIVWPAPKRGNPNDPIDAAKIAAGVLQPWRTAASDVIDWSLPCPSIFDTSEEIKQKWGLRAKRPLAEATLARIAKGVMRYVVNAEKPFIVPGFVTYAQQGGRNRSAEEPLHTITASRKDQNAVITPFVTKFNRGATGHHIDEPLHTITSHASETHGGGAAPLGIVTPILVGCGGRAAQTEPRPGNLPVATQTAKADACLAAVHLMTMRNAQKPFNGAGEPVHTVTAGGAGLSVVAAFLAQHNTDMVGHDAREPVSTIVGKGCTQGLVAAHLTHFYGSNSEAAGGNPEEPLKTDTAGGRHAGLVAAFIAKYYGASEPVQGADEPLHTVTTKPRHGLVTVTIRGEPYVIIDIGMRMLTPRERFRAQGFRPDYTIDHGMLEDGTIIPLTAEQQGRMCGNSVCPDEAEDLVSANYRERAIAKIRRPSVAVPLLEAAE